MTVDELAQEIRRVDGDSEHRLGAGALAEALMPFLSRPSAIVEEPTGWKLVPVEPTEAMLEASWQACIKRHPEDYIATALADPKSGHIIKTRNRYAAMLAAAPPSPALNAALTVEPAHPDDAAVDRFAVAMKAKLAKKRAEGRGGWERKDECTAEFLSELLRGHVEKGDPLDVGNLAMMLHQRGERILTVEPEAPTTRKKSVTLNLTDAEMDALEALAEKQDLSEERILIQGLRRYQLFVEGEPDLGPMLPPAHPETGEVK